MKAKQRVALIRAYGHLYRRHLAAGADDCFYCGQTRECLDHRPALITVETYGPESLHKEKIPLCLIPACFDCNMILGSEPELKEVSPLFRKAFRYNKVLSDILMSRIRFAQSRMFENELMPKWEDFNED